MAPSRVRGQLACGDAITMSLPLCASTSKRNMLTRWPRLIFLSSYRTPLDLKTFKPWSHHRCRRINGSGPHLSLRSLVSGFLLSRAFSGLILRVFEASVGLPLESSSLLMALNRSGFFGIISTQTSLHQLHVTSLECSHLGSFILSHTSNLSQHFTLTRPSPVKTSRVSDTLEVDG